MIDEPFRLTQRLMVRTSSIIIIYTVLTCFTKSDGKARPSLATTELEVLADGKDTYFDETIVKNVSAISYAGKHSFSVHFRHFIEKSPFAPQTVFLAGAETVGSLLVL